MKVFLPKKYDIDYLLGTRAVVDDLYRHWIENKDAMNDDEIALACSEYFQASARWSQYWYGLKPFWMSHSMWCNYWDRKRS